MSASSPRLATLRFAAPQLTSLIGAALLTACGVVPKAPTSVTPAPAPPTAHAPADGAGKARGESPTVHAAAPKPAPLRLTPLPVPGDLPAPPPPPLRAQPYDGLDGPLPNPPADLLRVANAVPKVEPLRKGSPNLPYTSRGQVYKPIARDEPVRERGVASWYGRKFHGQRTASGEIYNMYAMTAAHPTLPIPSYARVRNAQNGREVIVRVNDRGPFKKGRVMDLSYTAALKLGFADGVGQVEIERLTHESIRTGSWRRDSLFGNEPPSAGLGGSDRMAAATPDLFGTAPGDTLEAAAADPAETGPPLWAQHPDHPDHPSLHLSESTEAARTEAARGWWLQFGRFATADAAARHQRDLAARTDWLAPLLTPQRQGAQVSVQAGPFPSRDEAMAVAEQWQAERSQSGTNPTARDAKAGRAKPAEPAGIALIERR